MIARIKASEDPGADLIQREGRSLELHLGSIYSALVVQQYVESRVQHQTALRAAARLPLARRLGLQNDIRRAFERVVREHTSALQLVGLRANQQDLERMAVDLSAQRRDYQVFLDMRASAVGEETTAPRSLAAEIVPDTFSGLLGREGLLRLEVPDDWCGFEPVEGSVTKNFSRSFALKSTIKYPCGIKTCKKFGIKYPCGIKWCKKTITYAGGSIAFSLDVGYRIGCCGGIAWGSGKVKACGTVLNQTLCATCEAHVAGVIGAGRVTGSGGDCAYGLGVTVGASCELAGYTVFKGNLSYGWVIEAPCPLQACG